MTLHRLWEVNEITEPNNLTNTRNKLIIRKKRRAPLNEEYQHADGKLQTPDLLYWDTRVLTNWISPNWLNFYALQMTNEPCGKFKF